MSPSSRPGPRRGRTAHQLADAASRDTTSRSCPPHTHGRSSARSVEALSEEIAQLREALERRPVIGMARGVLMALWSCSEDEAWEVLVDVSQHSHTTLYSIAEAVLAHVHGEPLPAPLQEHLAAAVARLHAR
ncbi:ANTAR domain-containing protein [Streptomyces sp. NPDC047070]|uniref:ANTAR domain-containing protein n=1 Tax=Streptomyces sp. NPDC047070 TaxID=3154923 RepID=UPI003455CCCF